MPAHFKNICLHQTYKQWAIAKKGLLAKELDEDYKSCKDLYFFPYHRFILICMDQESESKDHGPSSQDESRTEGLKTWEELGCAATSCVYFPVGWMLKEALMDPHLTSHVQWLWGHVFTATITSRHKWNLFS